MREANPNEKAGQLSDTECQGLPECQGWLDCKEGEEGKGKSAHLTPRRLLQTFVSGISVTVGSIAIATKRSKEVKNAQYFGKWHV